MVRLGRGVPHRHPRDRRDRDRYSQNGRGQTAAWTTDRNLRLLRERTRGLGVPFTIDVFGPAAEKIPIAYEAPSDAAQARQLRGDGHISGHHARPPPSPHAPLPRRTGHGGGSNAMRHGAPKWANLLRFHAEESLPGAL